MCRIPIEPNNEVRIILRYIDTITTRIVSTSISKTLPLSKLLTSSRLLKNDSRYFRTALTGSIANAKFSVQCLNQALSVGDWWRQTGSNRRPPACKAGALPAELCPHEYRCLRCTYRQTNGGSGWIRTNDPRLIKTVL